MDIPTGVLPAVRRMKDFEDALVAQQKTIVLLETRISQLKSLVSYAKRAGKSVLLHVDLIQGLKTDEYALEFLFHEIKPDGILSTRGKAITLAKKQGLLTIQRMFLLDSIALEHNIKLAKRIQPDCVEVLPGLVPNVIEYIHEHTGLPIIAGGLIKREEEVERAFAAGAVAVSSSDKNLWDK